MGKDSSPGRRVLNDVLVTVLLAMIMLDVLTTMLALSMQAGSVYELNPVVARFFTDEDRYFSLFLVRVFFLALMVSGYRDSPETFSRVLVFFILLFGFVSLMNLLGWLYA